MFLLLILIKFIIKFALVRNIYSTFFVTCATTSFFQSSCFKIFFAKFEVVISIYHASTFCTLRKQLSGTFQIWKGHNGAIWCYSIGPAYQDKCLFLTNLMNLFFNFEARRCGNATMRLWIIHIWHESKSRRKICATS